MPLGLVGQLTHSLLAASAVLGVFGFAWWVLATKGFFRPPAWLKVLVFALVAEGATLALDLPSLNEVRHINIC